MKKRNREEGVSNPSTTHFCFIFLKKKKGRIGGGKKTEEWEWYEGTRTNMFLPVEVSEDGIVGFISSTLSFSGSLSPSLTRRVASEGFCYRSVSLDSKCIDER